MAAVPVVADRKYDRSLNLRPSQFGPMGGGFVALAMLRTGLAIRVGNPTRGFQAGQLLVIPIILWELFFATWLIVRGFNPSAVAADR